MSSSKTLVTLLYPAPATFDLDYYLKKHMPLVLEKWGPGGLKGYQVIKLEEASGFVTQCILHWESLDHFNKAKDDKEASAAVFADIAKFSNVQPTVFVSGDVVASTL